MKETKMYTFYPPGATLKSIFSNEKKKRKGKRISMKEYI